MKLIKILRSKPQLGGDPNQTVSPDDYMSAAVECLALIVVQAWVLAFLFSYDNILSNPLQDRMGYNNACVAWDVPPALYTSALLFFLPVYFTVRFVLLDMERMALDSSISAPRKRLVFVLESLFGASIVAMQLVFVLLPDKHPTAHTSVFIQCIFCFFLGYSAQFCEKPATVDAGSWVFLAVFGVTSCAYVVNLVVTLAQYEGVQDPFFPAKVGQAINVLWFACIPLSTYFMPRQGQLQVTTSFVPVGGDRDKLINN